MKNSPVLGLADLQHARRRLATGIRLTPCLIASVLSERVGMRIWLKRDDLQRTGSFKERGARNALLSLREKDSMQRVVAASAGNHALGLAYHGAQLGVKVTVVVPSSAPEVKLTRCRALGAEVVVHGATFDESQAEASRLATAMGAAVVHPFDDLDVIAGQGTPGLEILEQVPEVDTLVVPVGGGGMLAGVATAVKSLRPDVRIVAVEPENAAAFVCSRRHGRRATVTVQPTLADGLAVAQTGELAYSIATSRVDDAVTVSEREIAVAIAALTRNCGAVAEGAGATALAAVLAGKVRGRSIAVPVSGRNIDPHRHQEVLAREPDFQPRSVARAA